MRRYGGGPPIVYFDCVLAFLINTYKERKKTVFEKPMLVKTLKTDENLGGTEKPWGPFHEAPGSFGADHLMFSLMIILPFCF